MPPSVFPCVKSQYRLQVKYIKFGRICPKRLYYNPTVRTAGCNIFIADILADKKRVFIFCGIYRKFAQRWIFKPFIIYNLRSVKLTVMQYHTSDFQKINSTEIYSAFHFSKAWFVAVYTPIRIVFRSYFLPYLTPEKFVNALPYTAFRYQTEQ